MRSKDIAEWNKIIMKNSKKWRRTGWKTEVKICKFLSTLFLSQESPILGDAKNIVFNWIYELFFYFIILNMFLLFRLSNGLPEHVFLIILLHNIQNKVNIVNEILPFKSSDSYFKQLLFNFEYKSSHLTFIQVWNKTTQNLTLFVKKSCYSWIF